MTKRVKHCHKLVAETAKGLANDLYEDLMGHNELYSKWKATHPSLNADGLRRAFVARNWNRLVEPARTTLALMLRGEIDNAAKEQIYEALVLDATLIRGRQRPAMQLN